MSTREKFVNNLKTEIDEFSAAVEKIEVKIKTADEKSREKIKKNLKMLKMKRDDALNKIQELKNTKNEAWQELKVGTENVVDSLKDALDKTMAHFKKE